MHTLRSHLIYFLLLIGLLGYSSTGKAQVFESSNLPILVIDTQGQTIRDEPKIVASLKIIDNGTGKINRPTDAPSFQSKIGIELRGSTSQDLFPKKPFGFELRDTSGLEGISASILGWSSEEDFVLNATYNDKTLLREVVVYDFYHRMTRQYATPYRFCEVLLNGNYQGIYILMEKIKRDKGRVNISKLEPKDDSGDALTGGYILKVDKTTGSASDFWNSSYLPQPVLKPALKVPIQVEYPKKGDLTSNQFGYIQKYMSDFEKAIHDDTYTGSEKAYNRYIDVNSWVDYLLINELGRNVDAYRLSTFLYKDRESKGGKLFMGPIWDFNLTFGNADYCDGEKYQGWSFDFNTTCPDDYFQMPFWWKKLLADEAFATQVRQRYTALRQGVLQTQNLHRYIDSTALVIQDARVRNFQRWPVMGQKLWPNYFVGKTYEEEVNYLKGWITNRLNWMDASMMDINNTITALDPAVEKQSILTSYPNPARESATIEIHLPKAGAARWRLVDLWGRVLRETTIPENTADYTQTVDLRAFGAYGYPLFLVLEQDGKVLGSRRLLIGK